MKLTGATVDIIRERSEISSASNNFFVIIVVVNLRSSEVRRHVIVGEEEILGDDEFAGSRLVLSEKFFHLLQAIDSAWCGQCLVNVFLGENNNRSFFERHLFDVHSVFDDELFSTALLDFLFGLFLVRCFNRLEILRDANDLLLQIIDLSAEYLRSCVDKNARENEVCLFCFILVPKSNI